MFGDFTFAMQIVKELLFDRACSINHTSRSDIIDDQLYRRSSFRLITNYGPGTTARPYLHIDISSPSHVCGDVAVYNLNGSVGDKKLPGSGRVYCMDEIASILRDTIKHYVLEDVND